MTPSDTVSTFSGGALIAALRFSVPFPAHTVENGTENGGRRCSLAGRLGRLAELMGGGRRVGLGEYGVAGDEHRGPSRAGQPYRVGVDAAVDLDHDIELLLLDGPAGPLHLRHHLGHELLAAE